MQHLYLLQIKVKFLRDIKLNCMLHSQYRIPPILLDFSLATVLSRKSDSVQLTKDTQGISLIFDSNRLLGYLIHFATYAFVCQCTSSFKCLPSLLVFFQILSNFNSSCEIRAPTTKCQTYNLNLALQRKLIFSRIPGPPRNALHPVISSNACPSCLTETSGTRFCQNYLQKVTLYFAFKIMRVR